MKAEQPETTAAAAASAAPRRSGSQKRQRVAKLQIALSPDEHAAALAKAREAGMSASSYGRVLFLGAAGVRARRAPSVNAEALARATAALNKVGSNLNQIAHVLNAGRAAGSAETLAAVAEVRDILALFRSAAGMKAKA